MNDRRSSRLAAAALAMLTCLLQPTAALSEAGELLWQDTVDVSSFDQAFHVAGLHDRVFVAGFVGVGLGRDFVVRAYDARTGALLWQDQVHRGSSSYAASVAVEGKRVFVSGAVGSGCCPDWLTRAYDAETGHLLWEDQFDWAGGADRPRPGAIAVSEGLVFVVGSADDSSVWVVRTYDAKTGVLVWQDHLQSSGFNGAESLAVRKGRLFVGGFSDTDVSSDVLVRSYRAATGTLLWEHRTAGLFSAFTTMRALATDGNSVFAAASVANHFGKNDFLVQALHADKGKLLWQDRVDNGGDLDVAEGIAVRGRRVVATGTGGQQCLFLESPPSDCDVLVRSYDRKTGHLLWKKEIDVAGLDDQSGPHAVLAGKGAFYVLSSGNLTGNGGGDWLVQALHGPSGRLLWEDLLDTGGGVTFFGTELPTAATLLDGRLFVVGRTVDAADNWNFVVRAYDARGREFERDDDADDED